MSEPWTTDDNAAMRRSVDGKPAPPVHWASQMTRGRRAAGGGGGRRRGAALAAILSTAALALAVSACGNAGQALARQACVHVNESIRLYTASRHAASPRQAAAEQTKAVEQLEVALPLAAQANSADPQWNPLMTTLQEIGRNSEANLVAALRAQCAQADGSDQQTPLSTTNPPG